MIDSSSLLARSTSSVTCGPDLVSEEGIENENRFVTVQNRFFFDLRRVDFLIMIFTDFHGEDDESGSCNVVSYRGMLRSHPAGGE
jgi:hypothetical protein